MHPEPATEVRVAAFRDLDTTTLYAILKLRCDVFVVEQKCVYADLDGRDTETGTRHVWLARGDGHAGRLMEHALTVIGNRPSVLHAQAYLTGFYTRFGFERTGPEYLEDG